MFGTHPDNAIHLFFSNIKEGSGGLLLSHSHTGTVPLTGIAGAVAAEASQVAYC